MNTTTQTALTETKWLLVRLLIAKGVPIGLAVAAVHAFDGEETNLGRYGVLIQCGLKPNIAQEVLKSLGYIKDRLAWN